MAAQIRGNIDQIHGENMYPFDKSRRLNTTIERADDMQEATVVSLEGNSTVIRVPVKILRKAQVDLNDKLFFEVDDDKRIILTKAPTPKQGTLEYLFKDYEGGRFQTELAPLGEPKGQEKW
ncbi:MAG: AbrB/MazE/SpoVT family DNA-binding domain-containing protein [Oscillospiraceae bacterium]|nr:AbrB/MazE/SpoVT family DNA-binding domain-containing protein [Oscillospiraceae bacterium]